MFLWNEVKNAEWLSQITPSSERYNDTGLLLTRILCAERSVATYARL